MKKLIAIPIMLAAALSVIPWEYCVAGRAMGFPYPLVFPSHDETGLLIFEIGKQSHNIIISPFSFLGNLVISVIICASFLALYSVWQKLECNKKRQSDE